MPEDVDNCVESILDDNPDMDKSRAYAICNSMKNKGQLGADIDTTSCPDGQVSVNGECVEVETVETPPSLLSSPRLHLAEFNTEPIKRTELGSDTVRYDNLALLSEGVWTDQASKTPTLYASDAFSDIEARWDDSEHDGPPVNDMHDINKTTGQVNQTSVAGHIDPNSLRVNGDTLMGDVVLDTSTPAGELADNRLQDALNSGGNEGYGGPSVELDLDPQEHLREQSDHPRAEAEITGGYLTGLGLVMNQADKNIGFDKETAKRAVAMSSNSDKAIYTQDTGMTARMLTEDDEKLKTLAENLDTTEKKVKESLTALLQEDEEDEEDMEEEAVDEEPDEEMGDYEEDEEDEEQEMQDGDGDDDAIDVLEEQIDDLWGEIEEMKEAMTTQSEMSDELEAARDELADAESVAELQEAKDELDKRLSHIEDEEKTKTLADGESDAFDWSDPNDRTANYDSGTGTTF